MKSNLLRVSLTALALCLAACGGESATSSDAAGKTDATDLSQSSDITIDDADLAGNPFMIEWDTPYGAPPFALSQDEHYMPAIKAGVLEQRSDIEAIVNNP